MELAPDSLERLVPDALEPGDATGRATLALHLERYEFAARWLAPGRVLDIACGAGYGTKLLAERAAQASGVLGVDRSEAAVAYARERYATPGVEFQAGDAFQFRDAEGFASIVSLETLEHLDDPARFLARLVDLLRPGGVLIASVPTTPSVDVNPHHRHDFSERSFRRMLSALGLTPFDSLLQVQPVPLGAVLRRRETRMSDLRPNLLAWYTTHPKSLARRVWSTLRHGFNNHYLTLAARKSAS
jgi:SAM-dependent methyltransferase